MRGRGTAWCGAAAMAVGLAAVFVFSAGCRTSTRSGLPEHIKTVEVHLFENKTMYKGLEAYVTRRLIDRINGDPNIRLVTNGGDAILTGEITNVKRSTLRETTTNEPSTILIEIEAVYSLYDEAERRYIMEDRHVSSRATGMSSGLYETTRPGVTPQETEVTASASLADEIIRRTIGMW